MDLLEWYNYVNDELGDKRTENWMFAKSPVPVMIISAAYLYFVLKCGPRYMSNRPAYSLLTIMKIDNVLKIIANAWIVYLMLNNNWHTGYLFYDHLSYTNSPQDMEFARIAWYTLLLKIFDYTETCIFVFRKKQNQISFLHVYHHVSIVHLAWLNLKCFACGVSATCFLINCSVHVIMYSYYLLSAMGPQIRKLLMPIKPMITLIQLAQLLFIITFTLINIYYGASAAQASLIGVNAAIYFALFYNFYNKTYRTKTKQT